MRRKMIAALAIQAGERERRQMRSMIQRTALAAVLAAGLAVVAEAGGPTLYIAPQNGFETYIAGAVTKKQVPVTMTDDAGDADYVLKSVEESHPESTGGKIARCLFAYCAGIEGTSNASVQLVEVSSKHLVWAYEVRKAGANNQQSKAEAIAKHLKS